MTRALPCVLTLATIVLPGAALGQQVERGPIETERPDDADSANTVGRGVFQLESGYRFAREDDERTHALGELLLRYGLTEFFEVRVHLNSYQWVTSGGSTSSGMENAQFSVKFHFMDGGEPGSLRPALALVAGSSLPTGAREVDSGSGTPNAHIAASWSFTEALAFALNLKWEHPYDDDFEERYDSWGWSTTLSYALSDRWSGFFQFYGDDPQGDRAVEDYLGAGVMHLLNDDLQLDAHVGYGLNGLERDYFLGLGVSARW